MYDTIKRNHFFRVHFALGAPSARWRHRADPAPPRAEVQRGQDDLPQVLRPPPPQGHQLQEEIVSWTFLQVVPSASGQWFLSGPLSALHTIWWAWDSGISMSHIHTDRHTDKRKSMSQNFDIVPQWLSHAHHTACIPLKLSKSGWAARQHSIKVKPNQNYEYMWHPVYLLINVNSSRCGHTSNIRPKKKLK